MSSVQYGPMANILNIIEPRHHSFSQWLDACLAQRTRLNCHFYSYIQIILKFESIHNSNFPLIIPTLRYLKDVGHFVDKKRHMMSQETLLWPSTHFIYDLTVGWFRQLRWSTLIHYVGVPLRCPAQSTPSLRLQMYWHQITARPSATTILTLLWQLVN